MLEQNATVASSDALNIIMYAYTCKNYCVIHFINLKLNYLIHLSTAENYDIFYILIQRKINKYFITMEDLPMNIVNSLEKRFSGHGRRPR